MPLRDDSVVRAQSARVGASLLGGLGLDGLLVARNLADYADLAARAAAPGPGAPSAAARAWGGRWLRAVRRRLRAARQEAPLFDPSRWVRAAEAAVRAAWEVDAAAASAVDTLALAGTAGGGRVGGPSVMHVMVAAGVAGPLEPGRQ